MQFLWTVPCNVKQPFKYILYVEGCSVDLCEKAGVEDGEFSNLPCGNVRVSGGISKSVGLHPSIPQDFCLWLYCTVYTVCCCFTLSCMLLQYTYARSCQLKRMLNTYSYYPESMKLIKLSLKWSAFHLKKSLLSPISWGQYYCLFKSNPNPQRSDNLHLVSHPCFP